MAVAMLVGAAALFLAGWLGVSRSTLVAEQLPYIVSGGFAAAFLLILACTLWLSADLVDEWAVLRDVGIGLGRPEPSISNSPWTLPQVLFTVLAAGAGALTIGIGWTGVSGHSKVSSQLGWFNVAVGGLGLAGIGAAALLLHGRRSVGLRRRLLLPTLTELAGAGDSPDRLQVSSAGRDQLVAGAGMAHYHRAACPLVRGKAVRVAREDRHIASGRRPCGICQPDGRDRRVERRTEGAASGRHEDA